MSESNDFERLKLLFRRKSSLPPLSGATPKLIRAIDHSDASAAALEEIITTDPGLTTSLLRLANSAMAGFDTPVTSVRAAIVRLGHRAIRSLAISLTVQDVLLCAKPTPNLEFGRFARHSLFVGLMARYSFARRQKTEPFESEWSADEIMAAGVLHDLAAPLLATHAPDVYDRAFLFANKRATPVSTAFNAIYLQSMGDLAADACEAWNLPPVFSNGLRYVDTPWTCPEEFLALSCINYANHVANMNGFSTENWQMESSLAIEVSEELEIGSDELEYVIAGINRHVSEQLNSTKSKAA